MDVCHCTVNGEGPTEAVGERKDAGTNFPVRRSFGTRCAPAGTAPLTVHSAHAAESACACYMCVSTRHQSIIFPRVVGHVYMCTREFLPTLAVLI